MKRPMRRASDKLRLMADAAWARGSKVLADDLHAAARRVSKQRRAADRRS